MSDELWAVLIEALHRSTGLSRLHLAALVDGWCCGGWDEQNKGGRDD